MTILFLTRLFYPHIGGVEKHVYEVSKRLVAQGYKVIIVTEEVKEKNDKDFKLDGVDIYRIPIEKEGTSKKFSIWYWLFNHRFLMDNADIIHCHDVFFWFLPFKFFYSYKPIFITFHGYEGKYPPAKRAIWMRKLSATLAWGNICIGDFIKKWYGTKPTYVSYGGVNTFNAINSKEKGSNKKLKILLNGRLESDIGVKYYLEILKRFKEQNIQFTFETIGDGSLRKEVEKYGEVDGMVKDVMPYIQKADIVFASSYLAILDALLLKKTVIAVYDNPLKKDYLMLTPFSKWVHIVSAEEIKSINVDQLIKIDRNSKEKAHNWVKNQTWNEVMEMYKKLWKIQ